MRKLPIGIQTLSKIIEGGYLYVDKTREVFDLIRSGQYFFISRPRRFGKSLLVSTLREIFSGNRELFQGLYIYDKIEWDSYPVIHLDCSLIPRDTEERLKKGLFSFVEETAAQYHLTVKNQDYDLAFQELIRKLREKYQKNVVVLIDEYDKAILDRIDEPELAHKNREVLRNFYGVLKGSDEYLQFVFLTGVTKFSKVSIFSGLNNLNDITIGSNFSTITGLTQEEVERCFPEHLAALQQQEGMTREELLEQIRFWYNGYSWDGSTRLYNPFSLLNLFAKQDFGNYWFATGTPGFLIKLLRERQIDIATLEQQKAGISALDAYEIQHLETLPLLFQTGYLTIRSVKKARRGAKSYQLSFPNFEVQESLLTYLMADFSDRSTPGIQPLHEQMFEYLDAENLEGFIQMVQSLIAGIPYPLHLEEEAYYHSLFYMILKLLGAEVSAEVATDKGRVDGVLECDEKIYIIECKYSGGGRTLEALTKQALQQIHDRKYYEAFRNSGKKLLLLGIGFLEKQVGYQLEALA